MNFDEPLNEETKRNKTIIINGKYPIYLSYIMKYNSTSWLVSAMV